MEYALTLELEQSRPTFVTAHVILPTPLINKVFQETSITQQEHSHVQGFVHGKTPLGYIETAFRGSLVEHLKEFLYKYLVIDFLWRELRAKKIHFASEPRLIAVNLEPGKDARFSFECTVPESLALRGWKFYSFKPPKRKNYRDLDRQVESFLKTEVDLAAQCNNIVGFNDWICFDLAVVSTDKQPITSTEKNVWLKIGTEEIDTPFQDLFRGKRVGDTFYTSAPCLQEYFSTHLDTTYLFLVTIKDVSHDAHFSFEDFKAMFRLRTHKDLHKKLIEVFSYRNDLSQRRETIEEVFKMLLAQHPLEAPKNLVLRRQEYLMHVVQDNPDYQVYRMQKDFGEHIYRLAEKQIKEIIIIDQLALKENITVSHQDIKHYLNLTKRPRTKEFIYFQLPPSKLNDQEVPLATEELKQYALREKTLNYVIYHLTKT